MALLRFGTASVVLAIYALFTRMRLPDRGDLGRIAIAGLTGITIYHVALNYGEMTVQAGAASLLIAAGPVFTALMSTAFLGERLTGTRLARHRRGVSRRRTHLAQPGRRTGFRPGRAC